MKGIKIDGKAVVLKTGTSCGSMAWESPYIEISYNNEIFEWVGDSVPEDILSLGHGDVVHISGFAYGERLRRVKLTYKNDKGESIVFSGNRVTKIKGE